MNSKIRIRVLSLPVSVPSVGHPLDFKEKIIKLTGFVFIYFFMDFLGYHCCNPL